jgi:shikimate kinase
MNSLPCKSSQRLRLVPNIVLCGLPGSGKSTLGQLSAHLLGFGYFDLDQQIEQLEQRSISQIFKESGEEYFRQQETSLLGQIKNISNHVISVGGGALTTRTNLELISALGISIWLSCDSAEIARRLLRSPEELARRPLFADISQHGDLRERGIQLTARVAQLLAQRQKFFEQANFYLNVSFTSPDEGARSINGLLKKRSALKTLKRLPQAEVNPAWA